MLSIQALIMAARQWAYFKNNPPSIAEAVKSVLETYPNLAATQNKREKAANPWIPRDQLWKYLIDSRHHQFNDPMYFDNDRPEYEGEVGYLLAMTRAFILMERTLYLPLSLELIEALHDMAVTDVQFNKNKNTPSAQKGVRGHIGAEDFIVKESRNFVMNQFNSSVLGIEEALWKYVDCFVIKLHVDILNFELVKKLKINDRNLPSQIIHNDSATRWKEVIKFDYRRDDRQTQKPFFVTKMHFFIEKYKAKIDALKGTTDFINQILLIETIVEFVHAAEILHPFSDANARTFGFLILNKLLLQNQLPPCLIEDPNKFDFFSELELCCDVVTGIEKTLKLSGKRLSKDILDVGALKQYFNTRLENTVPISMKQDSRYITALNNLYVKCYSGKIDSISIPKEACWDEYHFLLIYAVTYNKPAAVKMCLENGISANFRRNDHVSLIHIAIQQGFTDIVKLLIAHHAKLDRTMHAITTVLEKNIEAKNRWPQVSALLQKHNISPLPTEIKNFTPIQLAVFFGHLDIVKLLLAAKVDISGKLYGISLVEIAEALGYTEITKALAAAEEKLRPPSPTTEFVTRFSCLFFAYESDEKEEKQTCKSPLPSPN